MNISKLTNEQVIELIQSDEPINKGRRAFSSASARIEQAGQQRQPLNPIEWRKMELEATVEIVNATGLHLPSEEVVTAPPMRFIYKNYKGIVRERSIIPKGHDYGSNEWHKDPQWFLVGTDTETGEERWFAVRDIQEHLK